MSGGPIERRDERPQFRTRDGSLVTELIHPSSSDATRQSVAEAIVEPGGETAAHLHPLAEEIYVFTAGSGEMLLGSEVLRIEAGDSVVIAPGTPHKLWNRAAGPLVLLCVCAPAYSHEDTVLLEEGEIPGATAEAPADQ